MKLRWIEIYCDESRQELFWSRLRKGARYIVIGGILIPRTQRTKLKSEIRLLRKKHRTFGEIRWKNVAPSRSQFYKELAELFLNSQMRFRCIILDKRELNLVKYYGSDEELGFYKFYYQLLHHWLDEFKKYSIFVDLRSSRTPVRLKELHKVLSNANLFSEIVQVQALPSEESVFIQLADLLVGAVGYAVHDRQESEVKLGLIRMLENRLGRKNLYEPTLLSEKKFNVFKVQLQRGEK